jgi:hypothetical protein
MMEWIEWINKAVFIKLKSSGDVYNATVLDIINGNKILILDKFGDKVIIDVDDILKLKELNGITIANSVKEGKNGG